MPPVKSLVDGDARWNRPPLSRLAGATVLCVAGIVIASSESGSSLTLAMTALMLKS
jgi:hypothetical protein